MGELGPTLLKQMVLIALNSTPLRWKDVGNIMRLAIKFTINEQLVAPIIIRSNPKIILSHNIY